MRKVPDVGENWTSASWSSRFDGLWGVTGTVSAWNLGVEAVVGDMGGSGRAGVERCSGVDVVGGRGEIEMRSSWFMVFGKYSVVSAVTSWTSTSTLPGFDSIFSAALLSCTKRVPLFSAIRHGQHLNWHSIFMKWI